MHPAGAIPRGRRKRPRGGVGVGCPPPKRHPECANLDIRGPEGAQPASPHSSQVPAVTPSRTTMGVHWRLHADPGSGIPNYDSRSDDRGIARPSLKTASRARL